MIKNILLLSLLLSFFSARSQENVSFPEDFKLDTRLLPNMVIATIPEEMHSRGVIHNPDVVEDRDAIYTLTRQQNENILRVYYEVYQVEEEKHDDAGVIVSEYVSKEALLNNLINLRSQSNLGYLIKDNYLIMVWSDVSMDSYGQINDMVDYYRNKIQAEHYQLPEHDVEVEVVEESIN